ncbi:hypothetical protein F4803DRAFT_21166 [Xylaria telfairii]|nr:hypothetical protein F4803DRAFT_21166 [Xylaria telfairii]
MSTTSGPETAAVDKATQTEDDWSEMKADVKKLVQAVQTFVPQPKVAETQRQFKCDVEVWRRELRPTPQKLESYVDLLLHMFFRDENGHTKLKKWLENILEIRHIPFPTFADNLILQFRYDDDGTLISPTPESASPLREFVMSARAQPYYSNRAGRVPVDENTARWCWWSSYEGFELYLGRVRAKKTRFSPWVSTKGWENSDDKEWPVSTRGYGTLCRLRAPIENGVLDFESINIILAQIGRWSCMDGDDLNGDASAKDAKYIALIVYFLGVFAGQWPSRNERVWFSCRRDQELTSNSGNLERCYLQVHFRCFEGVKSREKSLGPSGLKCDREQGQVAPDIPGEDPHFFEERRISIFGLLTLHRHPEILKCRNCPPAFYSVLVLGDFKFDPDESWDSEWRAGLEGTIAFHAAIVASVSLWQMKWNNVLDMIDERLRVHLEQTLDPEEIETWMFEKAEFGRSKLYVTILQILRIFGEYIRTVSDDLRSLDGLFMKGDNFPMPNMRPDELRIMRSNWESVKEFQKEAEEGLLSRISQKTDYSRTCWLLSLLLP